MSAAQLLSDGHDSARMTPVSSILQARLQRERDVDLSRSTSGSNMGSTTDLTWVGGRRSPTKSMDPDQRPQSSGSNADPSRQKGPTLKDMDQLLSTLHKQNFDLKLELYHRRERQTALEEQVDKLEKEKMQVEDMNEMLMAELDKREKAVEEAVAMILMLEANVEALAKERQMVRQVEADGFYGSPRLDSQRQPSTPKVGKHESTPATDDVKEVRHMPSFLSVGSANAENLRNVYLGTKGSVVSLENIVEGTPETAAAINNALVSPALSMLSESSFVSVYGQKNPGKAVPLRRDDPLPLSLDGGAVKNEPRPVNRTPSGKHNERPKQHSPRPGSVTRISSPGQYQPISSIMCGSPLQRIEKLDPSFQQRRQTPRPSSRSSRDASTVSRSNSRRVKDEKRQGLRHVSTESPGGASLNEQLPPTPDTTSSSTLQKMREPHGPPSRAKTAPVGTKTNLPEQIVSPAPPAEVERRPSATIRLVEQKPQIPVTAQNLRENGARNKHPAPIERPRSADETTVSHKKGHGWESDSDNDSRRSSLDIWMRASANKERGGRASPDLFGFPTDNKKGSWAMDAMFGPNTMFTAGGATAGLATAGLDSDQIHDLLAAQDALFGQGGGPLLPPHRNSSLQAQTVSAEAAPAVVQQEVQTQKSPRRVRPFRRNSDDAQARRDMKTPVPGQFTKTPQQPMNSDSPKQHYPPVTRQGGARQGLARLWRRSLGGGSSNSANETSAPAAPSSPAPPAVVTEPLRRDEAEAPLHSWVSKSGVLEEERSGATPPPIMRNPRHVRNLSDVDPEGVPLHDGSFAQGTGVVSTDGADSGNQDAETHGASGGGAPTGGRRKWLQHIRRTSTQKNKNG